MGRILNNKVAIGWTGVAGLLVCSGGCSDRRFVEQSAVREERINRHVSAYQAYDAAGPQRIEQTVRRQRKLDAERDEHLRYTCGLVRKMHERDLRRWQDEAPLRRARADALLHGHPENISHTWARMIY